jgi:hypothetical protein
MTVTLNDMPPTYGPTPLLPDTTTLVIATLARAWIATVVLDEAVNVRPEMASTQSATVLINTDAFVVAPAATDTENVWITPTAPAPTITAPGLSGVKCVYPPNDKVASAVADVPPALLYVTATVKLMTPTYGPTPLLPDTTTLVIATFARAWIATVVPTAAVLKFRLEMASTHAPVALIVTDGFDVAPTATDTVNSCVMPEAPAPTVTPLGSVGVKCVYVPNDKVASAVADVPPVLL